ncbi:MAG: hypothetical protein NVS3B20_19960 [Polyangiales bacterium]
MTSQGDYDVEGAMERVTLQTKLSELRARPKAHAPEGVVVSRNTLRSIQQSLMVEGYVISDDAMSCAVSRVLRTL